MRDITKSRASQSEPLFGLTLYCLHLRVILRPSTSTPTPQLGNIFLALCAWKGAGETVGRRTDCGQRRTCTYASARSSRQYRRRTSYQALNQRVAILSSYLQSPIIVAMAARRKYSCWQNTRACHDSRNNPTGCTRIATRRAFATILLPRSTCQAPYHAPAALQAAGSRAAAVWSM